MVQMKTLTVNGNTYTVTDSNAARIDDTQVGAQGWSSKNIVDKLCPAFTRSGAVVTCTPVEGYPLEVVSTLDAAEEGYTGAMLYRGGKNLAGHRYYEGIGTSNIEISHNDGVYKNRYINAVSSTWVVTTVADEYNQSTMLIPGTYVFSLKVLSNTGSYSYVSPYAVIKLADGTTVNMPNGTPVTIDQPGTVTQFRCDNSGAGFKAGQVITFTIQIERGSVATAHAPFEGGDIFTANFGKTVYGGSFDWVSGKLTDENGLVTQLTPQQILALSGTNTLYSDTGDTEATGKADPGTVLQTLSQAITALGGSI